MGTCRSLRSGRSQRGHDYALQDTTNDVQESFAPVRLPTTPNKRKRSHDVDIHDRHGSQRESMGAQDIFNPATAVKNPESPGCPSLPEPRVKQPRRRAAPNTTNATLVTPKGSRLTALPPTEYGLPLAESTDSELTTSTDNILQKAYAHLIQADPRIKPLIEAHPCDVFSPRSLSEDCEPFKTICCGIIAQQVSGAAASSIRRKFVGLFKPDEEYHSNDYFPPPARVAECKIPFLRQAGLSERKAEYIQVCECSNSPFMIWSSDNIFKGLAEKFVTGELSPSMLLHASNEEVIERLVQVRGLGQWSAEVRNALIHLADMLSLVPSTTYVK